MTYLVPMVLAVVCLALLWALLAGEPSAIHQEIDQAHAVATENARLRATVTAIPRPQTSQWCGSYGGYPPYHCP